MPRQYLFEHTSMPIPDRIALDPRCKVALVYQPENGKPYCEKCSNDEPGIPFVRLDAVLALIPLHEFGRVGTDTITVPRDLAQLRAMVAALGVK